MILKKFIKGLLFFLVLILINSCEKVDTPVVISKNKSDYFVSFIFKAKDNASFLNDDIVMSLNSEGDIVGHIPHYTEIDSLIPSFEFKADSVWVGGNIQQSGISSQNFKRPPFYYIKLADGTILKYQVKIKLFNGLPVMHIDTENRKEIDSKVEYIDAKFYFNGIGIFNDIKDNITIRGRGNSTWLLDKKPYIFKLSKQQSIAGLPNDRTWILLANYLDRTGIRTDLAFDISRVTMLDWTPNTQPVDVFINQEYLGTYLLSEKIKISSNKVNITDDGYIIEINQQIDSEVKPTVYFTTDRGLNFQLKEPNGIDTGSERYNWIKNYVTQAERVLYSDNFKDPIEGYAKYIDVISFADWYLVNEISRNNDAVFFKSCYMNIAPNGKLKMGPVWDFDLAFGNTLYNEAYHIEGFYIKNALWVQRLFEDEEFVELVKERFVNIKLNMPRFLQNINYNVNDIELSMMANNEKWNLLYNKDYDDDPFLQDVAVGSYNNEVQHVKNFLTKRMQWLEQALNDL